MCLACILRRHRCKYNWPPLPCLGLSKESISEATASRNGNSRGLTNRVHATGFEAPKFPRHQTMTRDQKEKGIQVAAVLSFTQVKPGGPRDPDMFVVCEKTILTFVLHELGLTGFCGNFCACFICVRNKSIKSNKLI